jgi:hypothetical protein
MPRPLFRYAASGLGRFGQQKIVLVALNKDLLMGGHHHDDSDRERAGLGSKMFVMRGA